MAKPKAVLIENVRGIVTNNNGYAKKRIYEIFESRGYGVNHMVLNAMEYGVPQRRLRNFFVMLKSGRKFDFDSIRKNESIVTVKEAIGELYNFESSTDIPFVLNDKPKTDYQKYLRKKIIGFKIMRLGIHLKRYKIEYHLCHKVEIGKMYPRNFGHQTDKIDIHLHIND